MPTWIIPDWIAALIAAPFVGSFLAVLIRRLPAGRDIVWSRSACETCGANIQARDLIPLWSHLRLRGRCRQCAAPIAPQHWRVELAAVGIASWAALIDPAPLLWLDCAFGWTLLALAWIDWEHMVLPDALTLPLLPAGLAASLWLEPGLATDHALAAAIGYAALRLIAMLYRRFRGREGLGQGDAKLLAAIGAWTGLETLPWVLLGAALAGLAAALLMRLRGQEVQASTAIPFGPCLAFAGWVVRLYA